MTTKTESNNIFIDTNVLIGAYSEDPRFKDDRECWRYLCGLNGKRLFISSLSVAQLVSVFQKRFDNKDIKSKVDNIVGKATVVDFTFDDIRDSLKIATGDMEDNIQYVICKKVRCTKFVTRNTKDYGHFLNLEIVRPKKVRTISR